MLHAVKRPYPSTALRGDSGVAAEPRVLLVGETSLRGDPIPPDHARSGGVGCSRRPGITDTVTPPRASPSPHDPLTGGY